MSAFSTRPLFCSSPTLVSVQQCTRHPPRRRRKGDGRVSRILTVSAICSDAASRRFRPRRGPASQHRNGTGTGVLRFLAHSLYLYSSPAGQPFLISSLPAHSTWKVLAANALFLQFRTTNYGTNAALWSLANEFWYYLVFPPLLLAIADRSAWRRLFYLATTLLLLRFLGPGLAASFAVWLLGFVVSILPLVLSPRFQGAAAALCLAQFLGVNWLLKVHALPSTLADLLLGFSFSLLLYAIAHRRQPVGSLRYQRVATRLAGFSYTLYLTHLPFLTFAIGLLIRPWRPWSKDLLHFALAALVLCATYLYSYLFYLLFERNTDRIRRFLSPLVLAGSTTQEPLPRQPQSAS